MKTLILTILTVLSFNTWSQVLSSEPTTLSQLDLASQVKARIQYRKIMTVDSVKVERLPVGFDPDVRPAHFYCLTTISASVGEMTLTATVENKTLQQTNLPLKAIIFNASVDDGKCLHPRFTTNTWYEVSLQTSHEQMILKGKKRLQEYQLALSVSSTLGKVIFTQAENGATMVRGFDFNNGKEARTMSELAISWAAYYKAHGDSRIMLQEQGRVTLSE